MGRVAFLSTDKLEDFCVYDDLLEAPLAARGWQVDTVPWRASKVDWCQYDKVVVRSTWDYQQDPEVFLACLATIDQQTRLYNSLALMQWNVDKRYLQALAAQGVAIVPSVWGEQLDVSALPALFDHFATRQLVIKPTISANADDTFWLDQATLPAQLDSLKQVFAQRSHIIQPFVPAITEQGEYSLFYFGGKLSHTILKTPAQGDFRVQEEHGGRLQSLAASEPMQQMAEQVLSALPEPALYARIDVVWHQQQWQLMEVELIEPSLYFNLDPASPGRFVDALLAS